MSLWQFQAAVAGWAKAQGAEVSETMTDPEFEAVSAMLDTFPDRID